MCMRYKTFIYSFLENTSDNGEIIRNKPHNSIKRLFANKPVVYKQIFKNSDLGKEEM